VLDIYSSLSLIWRYSYCLVFQGATSAHGWLFRLCALPDEWEERLKNFGVSDGCISNLRVLECEGYDWVHFQADAPIVEELQHWDW
ncbi:hypothetical protein RAG83_24455, partial [Klebsiella quasipneumoniae subsp. similipneumoniae]